MGMKHLSELHEDWSYGEMMYDTKRWVQHDREFCFKQLNNWNFTSIPLFCFPSEYYLILDSTRKKRIRRKWPICYLVAKDDVIPIKIDKHPIVALQDKSEYDYVWKAHKHILDIIIQLVRDNWKDILLHYLGYIEDIDIHDIIEKNTGNGARYDPDFLEKYPMMDIQPNRIYSWGNKM